MTRDKPTNLHEATQTDPKGRFMKTNIAHFSTLPDEAMVSVKTVAAVLEQATVTVWRRAAREPYFPKPRKLGNRCTRWKVGDLRAFLAGGAA